MPTASAICAPVRYSGMVSENSLITMGEIRAKTTPSIPSKPQPRPLAVAICQCVLVILLSSVTARKLANCIWCCSSGPTPPSVTAELIAVFPLVRCPCRRACRRRSVIAGSVGTKSRKKQGGRCGIFSNARYRVR